MLGEPATPLACGIDADAQISGDPHVGTTTGGSQHDLRANPVPVRRLRAAGPSLQGLAFGCGQHDRHGTRRHHRSK
jgi:hypothetical protein